MFAMLMVATALVTETCVQSSPYPTVVNQTIYIENQTYHIDSQTYHVENQTYHVDNQTYHVENQTNNIENQTNQTELLVVKALNDDAIMKNSTEILRNFEPDGEIEKINIETITTGIKVPETNRNISVTIQVTNDTKKRAPTHLEDVDVVDREDHVTQYLEELLVNTDSEITGLQASEVEDDRPGVDLKDDLFFTFLTSQDRAAEVEDAWSSPLDDLKKLN